MTALFTAIAQCAARARTVAAKKAATGGAAFLKSRKGAQPTARAHRVRVQRVRRRNVVLGGPSSGLWEKINRRVRAGESFKKVGRAERRRAHLKATARRGCLSGRRARGRRAHALASLHSFSRSDGSLLLLRASHNGAAGGDRRWQICVQQERLGGVERSSNERARAFSARARTVCHF